MSTDMILSGVDREDYYERLVWEDEHPDKRIGHVCSICLRPVDGVPCPEHAPSVVPGLTKVECAATPPHFWWHPAGDYYDAPCFQCLYEETRPKPQPCAHWGWRRWSVARRVFSLLYRPLHITRGYSISYGGPDHHGCIDSASWQWPWKR